MMISIEDYSVLGDEKAIKCGMFIPDTKKDDKELADLQARFKGLLKYFNQKKEEK